MGAVRGVVPVPGDKSISHRALIVGALARGRTYVGNLSPAGDVASTAGCLRACGATVRPFGDGRVSIEGAGPGRSLRTPAADLDCGNSGTTMRLLAGALAGHDVHAVLDGDDSLRRRPMERVAKPLRRMGALVETAPGGTAPLHVQGRATLTAGDHTLPVASAQLKSAVLLAALSADGPVTVREPAPSRDHTERLLRHCGIALERSPGSVTMTPGPLAPFGLRVPGDLSSAAFFLCLAAPVPGAHLRCAGVTLNPGRTGVIDALRAMGARLTVEETDPSAVEPAGDVLVEGSALEAVEIAGELTVRCIDEIPALAVLATQAEGWTHIRDAGELRLKESDRIAEVAAGLRALGAECAEQPDGLSVRGPVRLRPAALDARGDHRLAMAWAVAAALVPVGAGASVIHDADCAAVSYPGFFAALRTLGG